MDGRRKLQFDDEKQQADVKQEADEKKKRMKSKKQMKCEEEAQTDRQKLRKTGYHQTGTFSIWTWTINTSIYFYLCFIYS